MNERLSVFLVFTHFLNGYDICMFGSFLKSDSFCELIFICTALDTHMQCMAAKQLHEPDISALNTDILSGILHAFLIHEFIYQYFSFWIFFSFWFPSVKIIQNVFSYWLLDLTDRKRLQWITDLTSFSSQFRIGCCCSQLFCIFKAVEIFFSFCSVWVFLFGFVLYFENWHFCQWQRLIWTITFCWCVCNL